MRKTFIFWIVLVSILVFVEERDIHLRNRLIRVFPNHKNAMKISNVADRKDGGSSALFILQLASDITKEGMEAVSDYLDLQKPSWVHYLDGGAYLVYGNIRRIEDHALELEEVTFVERFRNSDRTSLDFDRTNLERRSEMYVNDDYIPPTIFLEAAFYTPITHDFRFENWIFNDTTYEIFPPLIVRIKVVHSHNRVLERLKRDERIFWIGVGDLTPYQKLMNRGGRQVVFGGSRASSSELLWDMGLTGKGQIVGVVDTGVDVNHCFFHDPDHLDVPYNTYLPDHRKIAYYRDYSYYGGSDNPSGHGTHVAGSVAGSVSPKFFVPSEVEEFGGVARDARLYIVGCGGINGGISVPKPYGSNLFNGMQSVGAYIASNSWGCDLGSLGIDMKKNEGFGEGYYPFWSDRKYCYGDPTITPGKLGELASDEHCRACFGRPDERMGCANLCNRYTAWEYELDQWLRTNKYFTVLFSAGNSGGKTDGDYIIGSPSTSKNSICVGASRNTNENMIRAADFVEMDVEEDCCTTDFADESCCPGYRKMYFAQRADKFNEQVMTTFSGRGPSILGITSPLIVAPGELVVSAHARGRDRSHEGGYCGTGRPFQDNEASLKSMLGTSMSTPLVAGLLAIFRQWFEDGNHESITKPTSYLLKAMLVHGTRTLTGGVTLGGNFVGLSNSYPTNKQGFGLVVGKDVLYGRSSRGGYILNIEEKTIRQDEEILYCFEKTEDDDQEQEFRVTIAWLDLPTSPVVEIVPSLVQNLDLIACMDDGNCWAGNQNPWRDTSNLVLQARCGPKILKRGDRFSFRVEGTSIQGGEENFALLYSGYGYRRVNECSMVNWEDAVFPVWSSSPSVYGVHIFYALIISILF